MDTDLYKLRTLESERGFALVYIAICLVVLLGFLGLAVDLGHMQDVRGELQNDADAAALAGATKLYTKTGTTYTLDLDSAQAEATAFIAQNKSDNTALKDGTVEVGFWDTSWDPTTNHALLPPSTPPSATHVAAVKVTVKRAAGSNGGAVPTWFMKALGTDSAPVGSRPAVAVVGYAGSAPPGKVFPIALSACMTDQYFGQDPPPSPPTEIYISGPYVPGGSGCMTGQWTSFQSGSNADSTIQGYLKDLSTVPGVNYGDNIFIQNGAEANLYNITNKTYAGQDVIMPIVDSFTKSGTGSTMPVQGFATFHIDGADGKTKQVWGHFVSYTQTLSGSTAGGSVSDVLSMPQAVQ